MNRLLIPDNLKIDDLKDHFPTCKGFKDDKVFYVCHAIIHASTKLKDSTQKHALKKHRFFVPLQSEILQKFLGSDYYSDILKWMGVSGIIETDGSWEKNVVSKGYRFTEKYRSSKSVFVAVTDTILLKKEYVLPMQEERIKSTRPVKHLFQWFNGLRIVEDAAIDEAELRFERDMETALSYNGKERETAVQAAQALRSRSLLLIDNITTGKCKDPFQDKTGRRLHSVITQLPKNLRPFVSYNGKGLVQHDLSNSQLYCTLYLLQEKNWRIRKTVADSIWSDLDLGSPNLPSFYSIMYSEISETVGTKEFYDAKFQNLVCQGQIYDYLRDVMDENGEFFPPELGPEGKRKIVKDLLLYQMYADEYPDTINFALIKPYPDKDTKKYLARDTKKHKGLYVAKNKLLWDAFEREFPLICHLYRFIKKRGHQKISRILQRVESTGVLEVVCRNLYTESPHVPVFTLHDCLVTTEEFNWEVHAEITMGMLEFIGFDPHIKSSPWNEPEEFIQIEPIL